MRKPTVHNGRKPSRAGDLMSEAPGFANLVPGFDFLQGLVKNAGASIPGIGQWVAPTLDPDELGKRIEELRTVKFWLEQNAQLLETTIQALEVQRMTLSTLKSMNLQMGDLRESLQVRVLDRTAATAVSSEPASSARRRAPRKKPKPEGAAAAATAAATTVGPIDPMQWWTALTKQFTEIAASAVRQTQAEAATTGTAPAGEESPATHGGSAAAAPPRVHKVGRKQAKRGGGGRDKKAPPSKPADA
jgi:hypothetical protein